MGDFVKISDNFIINKPKILFIRKDNDNDYVVYFSNDNYEQPIHLNKEEYKILEFYLK